ARLRQQHDELVAAETRQHRIGDRLEADRRIDVDLRVPVAQHVLQANQVAQRLRQLLQHAVGRLVTDGIVDQLEVVEIDEQHGELRALPARSCQNLLEVLVEKIGRASCRESV